MSSIQSHALNCDVGVRLHFISRMGFGRLYSRPFRIVYKEKVRSTSLPTVKLLMDTVQLVGNGGVMVCVQIKCPLKLLHLSVCLLPSLASVLCDHPPLSSLVDSDYVIFWWR